jgi:hypothetical protein
MAHRVKCKVCLSCMSPVWVMPDRYYYCGFCRQWYGGTDADLQPVPNPNQDKIDAALNKIEDPVLEEENDKG